MFYFDEMQFAEKEDLQTLLAALHRIAQCQLPVALVCAGLLQLPGRLAEASSYAERLACRRRFRDVLDGSGGLDVLKVISRIA